MAKKIETVDGFDVFFTAETEEESKRHHFIEGCGWTEAQYKEYVGECKGRWFCAHVEIKLAGYTLSDQYLGCCHYHDDYFSDMVKEGISEARTSLPTLVAELKQQAVALVKTIQAFEGVMQ